VAIGFPEARLEGDGPLLDLGGPAQEPFEAPLRSDFPYPIPFFSSVIFLPNILEKMEKKAILFWSRADEEEDW
jgi:hypothetical protein